MQIIGEGAVLTVAEVAEVLRLNKMTVYRAVRDGTIPSVRVGDRFLIPRARLDAMLRGEVVAAGGAR